MNKEKFEKKMTNTKQYGVASKVNGNIWAVFDTREEARVNKTEDDCIIQLVFNKFVR